MKVFLFFIHLILALNWLLWSSPSYAQGASVGQSSGYIQDVQKEKEIQFYEVFLFAQPTIKEKPLTEIIFNAQLSKEFKNRYRERFGTLDTESIGYQHNDFSRLDLFRATPQAVDKNNERKRFADYMIKRLAEWHIDNYVRSEPNLAPVYELKEKLKKVEVKVDKETKVEGRYSLAENILDIIVDNKYLETTRLSLDFERNENILVLGQPINSRNRIVSTTESREGRSKLELIKYLTSNLSTSYGVSAAYKDGESPRDTRLAFAFGYRF